MQEKLMKKRKIRTQKKIDYAKIQRAYGILRTKQRKPVATQRMLRDEWK